jgi:hypothetical protein
LWLRVAEVAVNNQVVLLAEAEVAVLEVILQAQDILLHQELHIQLL